MNGASVFGFGPVRLPVFVAIFKAGFDIIAVEISAERVWDILLRSVPDDDSSLEWIERQQRADPNDRAFTVLDELDADSIPESANTDARSEDDLVDEWDSSGELFTMRSI